MTAAVAIQAVQVNTTEKKQANKDLQKTRLCVYNLEGKCGYGANCTFAHYSTEIRGVPDLRKTQICAKFMEGKCSDENCTFAHGQEELKDSPNFKKKMCKWHTKGTCRNGAKCGFVHDLSESRAAGPPPGFGAPPGLEKMALEEESDASTEAPPSQGKAAIRQKDRASPPDAPLFQLAAARGAAPLKTQVALMSSAVGALQAKLAMLEEQVLQSQVTQMQQQIQQLNEQCWALEAGMPEEPTKSRLSAKAAPFVPFMPNDLASDDSTSAGSENGSN